MRAERQQELSEKRSQLLLRLQEEGSKWAPKLEKCGEPFRLLCEYCGTVKTVEKRCDLRWCPVCAGVLAARAVARHEAALNRIHYPLFVTLTTKNFDGAPSCFREVRRGFTKLRRLRWWKRAVLGGLAGFEITNKGKGWHPHVHALIDCKWLSVTVPQPAFNSSKAKWRRAAVAACNEVAAQWSLCLGGRKSSVKVRRVWTRDDGDIKPALREVLKYSVTSEALDEIIGDLDPLLDELKLTRLQTSWGSCYGLGVKKKSTAGCQCDGCKKVGYLMPEFVLEKYHGFGGSKVRKR
jgi:hypothetical protein